MKDYKSGKVQRYSGEGSPALPKKRVVNVRGGDKIAKATNANRKVKENF